MEEINNLLNKYNEEINKRFTLTNSLYLAKTMEELGEVADVVMRLENINRASKTNSNNDLKTKLSEELCDVFLALALFAKANNIDLLEKSKKVIKHNLERWKSE